MHRSVDELARDHDTAPSVGLQVLGDFGGPIVQLVAPGGYRRGPDPDLGGQRSRELPELDWRDADTVIGHRTSRTRGDLQRVEAVHVDRTATVGRVAVIPVRGAFAVMAAFSVGPHHLTPGGEIRRVLQMCRAGAEEIGVERDDDVSLRQVVCGVDDAAERLLAGLHLGVTMCRLVLNPLRTRVPLLES